MNPEREDTEAKWRGRAYRVWTIVGVCLLIGVVIYLCGIIWQAVATVIVTTLTVFLLHGAVNLLERRYIPRWAGTLICFLVLSILIAGCILALIPTLVAQISSFAANLPGYINQLQTFLSTNDRIFGTDIHAVASQALSNFTSWFNEQSGTIVSSLAGGIIGSIIGIGNFVVIAFISLVCSFWILMDLPKISRELRSLFDDKLQDDIDVFTYAFGNAVYGWAKSTLICAVVTGVLSYIAFLILGIPYSAVLAFLCGILYLVPYIGPMVSCVLVAVIALFVSPVTCIISIVFNVVLNNVIGNIVSPRLMKSSVSVYPALILIVILVGSAVGGIAGMLLSIPIIAALQGVFVTYFEARTGKTIATEDGVLFQKKASAKLPKLDTSMWRSKS